MKKSKSSLIAFILLLGVIQFIATKASAGTCNTNSSTNGPRTVVTFTSSDSGSAQCASWSVPNGVSSVNVLAVGGGGGGGDSRGGGGGGGGVASLTNFTVTGGETLEINIGGGGVAGDGDSRGGSGGNSSVVRNSNGKTFAIAGGGGGGGSHHGTNPRTLVGNEGDGARGNGGFKIDSGEAASGSGGGAAMSYINQTSDSDTAQTRWFYRGGDHGDFNTVGGVQRGGGNQGGGSYFCPWSNDSTYDPRRATGGGGGAGSDGKGNRTTSPEVNYDCNNWTSSIHGPHGGAGTSNSITGSAVVYGPGGGGADARGNGEGTTIFTLGRGDGYDGGGSGQSYYNCCGTPVQSVSWSADVRDGIGAGGGGGVDAASRGGTGIVIISYVGLPTISSCSANSDGTTVTINFTESSLSTSNIPPRTAFAINNSGSPRLVRSVNTPTSNSLVLNVATIYQGESLTVTYTSPGGTNSLQNVNGQQIASGSCPSVTNDSTVNLIAKYDSTSQSYPGSGSVWNDISGNPNHSPYNLDIKGPVDFTTGVGFKFNGSNYTPSPATDIECGSDNGVNRTSCIRHAVKSDFQNLGTTWSIFTWVRLDSTSVGRSVVATLSRCPNKLNENNSTSASGACSNQELIFGVDLNRVYAWDYDNGFSPGNNFTGWESVTTLTTNTWYYIGMVRNTVGSNTTYTMYINGEAARIRLNGSDTTNTSTTIARSPNYGTDNLNLGGDWRDNNGSFPGTIKAFYIYDDAVSAAVASNEYTSTLVTMSAISDQLFERGSVTASASASAGTISYSATGSCSVNSNDPTVTFTGTGSCTLTATGSSGGLVDRTFNIVQNLDLNLPTKLPVYPTAETMKIPTIPITTSNSQRVFTCLNLVGTDSSTTSLSNTELSIDLTTSGDETVVTTSPRTKTINSTLAQARTLYERVRISSSSGRLLGYNSGSLYLLWRSNLIADSVNDVASCNNFDAGARGWIKLEDIQATQRRQVDVTVKSGNDS